MSNKQKISLVGLIVSIIAFWGGFISIAVIGEVNVATFIITPLFLFSIPAGIVFTVLLIVFSVTKNNNVSTTYTTEKQILTSPKNTVLEQNVSVTNTYEERTFKNSIKRTPWYIWVIFSVFSLIGLVLFIIPPLSIFGIIIIGFFWFACFWLPYYTWKNEHIRAPWPSSQLTDERIRGDIIKRHHGRYDINFEYRIVEDTVKETNFSLTDDYTPTTITFQKNGKFNIKPSMFQKYYSPIEIAMNIQEGEGVYLIFSNKTNSLEFVYRKKYCTL